jgi:hypothetical protein
VAVDITDPAMTLYLEAQGSRWLLVDLRKEPGF